MKSLKLVTLLFMAVLLAAVPLYVAAASDPGPTAPSGAGRRGTSAVEAEIAVSSSEVWVEPERSSVMPGDVFTVQVMKNTAEALSGFDLYVTWDNTKLAVDDVRRGGDVDAGSVFTATQKDTGPPAPFILHVVSILPGAELMAAGEGAMMEIDFEAIDVGSSVVDVIDEDEEFPGVYEAVQLSDTDQNTLPTPDVRDGTVVAGNSVFLPLVLRGY